MSLLATKIKAFLATVCATTLPVESTAKNYHSCSSAALPFDECEE